MLQTIVQNFVVDLIGENHQAVVSGDFHNAIQNLIRVQSTRGIIGINDHNALGLWRDFGANVVQIGRPSFVFIAHIMHRRSARQTGRRCPQRIVGCWQQKFVSVVKQGVGGHHDQFACAIAQIDVIKRHALDALLLGLVHDSLAGTKNTFAV